MMLMSILALLIIGCTLPVTSCEAERSFFSVQLTMNHLRSSMGEGRLPGLTLMNLRNTVEIYPREIISRFVSQHSLGIFKGSVLFEND